MSGLGHYISYRHLREPELDRKIGRGLLKAVTMVEAEAKGECPVDTDRLRSSITSRVEDDGTRWAGIVGTEVEYASFVELGTSRMSARPFLFPALENVKSKLKDIFKGA